MNYDLFKRTERPRGERIASASPVADKGVAYTCKTKEGEYKTCLCINNRVVHKRVFHLAYSALRQMRQYAGIKSVFALMLLFMLSMTSCSSQLDDESFMASKAAPVSYSAEITTIIDNLYDICVEIYGEDIPENIINDKLETIRFCDLVMDPHGDFICELDGYEDIYPILWPEGIPLK